MEPPKKRSDVTGVGGGSGEVDLTDAVELGENRLVQPLPGPGLLCRRCLPSSPQSPLFETGS